MLSASEYYSKGELVVCPACNETSEIIDIFWDDRCECEVFKLSCCHEFEPFEFDEQAAKRQEDAVDYKQIQREMR